MTHQVWAPVITPFQQDLTPDTNRFIRHCQWLQDNDVGLAIFGTNSEANSLSIDEKKLLLDALIDSGVSSRNIIPGTGSCAVTDAVTMTRHAVSQGCAGVLMLPPFYYKEPTEEGLYRYYAEVIERVSDSRLRIYLYHIPAVASVPISFSLIERLLESYPQTIAGIKDSSGNWENTKHMIKTFSPNGFKVFAGSEPFLLNVLRAGGAGCISATANVNPAKISQLAKNWEQSGADLAQQHLTETRRLFERYPVIPAMKAATAHFLNDPTWNRVRPPLVELDDSLRMELIQTLENDGFAFENYPA